MKRTQIRNLGYLIFFIAIAVYLFVFKPSSLPSIQAMVGQDAPKWELNDLHKNLFKSDYISGSVILLNFWTTWSPDSKEEVLKFIQLNDRYEKKGFKVVGVALDDIDSSDIEPIVDGLGVDYISLRADSEIVQKFGSFNGVPTTFIIDREGKIRYAKQGINDLVELETIIAELL